MTAAVAPTVFVVDDDDLVRASIHSPVPPDPP
jgi:hypothetical protein